MSRPALDVSALPTIVYGPRATLWWGILGLIAIEGTALAITGVAYLYLRQNFVAWPPEGTPLPALGAATAELAVLVASVIPMAAVDWLARRAQRRLVRSEEHTSELQSRRDLVCRLLLEKKN